MVLTALNAKLEFQMPHWPLYCIALHYLERDLVKYWFPSKAYLMEYSGSIHMNVLLLIMLAVTSGTLLAFSSTSFGYAEPKSSSANASILTPNQIAAGGPIPPNYTLAQQEQNCVAAENNLPWSKTLNAFENYNSNRSHYWSCSEFTGSFTGPNKVYAYKSPTYYPTPFTIVTRGINEMYVYGGVVAANPPPSGPYVSKVEPGSLKELWRTELLNANMTQAFTGGGGMYTVGDNGDILVTTNSYLFKLNGTTGAVEGALSLPTGATLPSDTYFNGLNGWPDGTLAMKDLTRAAGCTLQSLSAVNKCPGGPSVLSVVDSKNMKVLDSVQLPELVGGRVTTTVHDGKNYVYIVTVTQVYRYEWNGKNITLDKSWGPVPYLKPGQTGGTAAAVMGDWVVIQTNGIPSDVPLSEVAISQTNSSKVTRIDPMPLQPGQKSYIPNFGVMDLPNNRIYGMDEGPGKVVGINFDQKTGNMTLAWSVDQKTFGWVNAIGPPNHRVIVGTNLKLTNETNIQPGPKNPNYTEQVQWRDAATGKLLAASDFFSPMSSGSQVVPGYGGLSYHVLIDGHIMALKVLPSQSNTTSSVNSTSQK